MTEGKVTVEDLIDEITASFEDKNWEVLEFKVKVKTAWSTRTISSIPKKDKDKG